MTVLHSGCCADAVVGSLKDEIKTCSLSRNYVFVSGSGMRPQDRRYARGAYNYNISGQF